jgi:hypothetical protein
VVDEEPPAPLTDTQRSELRALIFDTNAFPKGRLNIELLTKWARLSEGSNLELWIPEPILWEWAEHAAADWYESVTAASSARRALDVAGLEVPVSVYSTKEEVIEAVEASIRSIGGALRVLPLTGTIAVEAIRDQILQRQPGRKKENVKTGAADSAWLRLMLEQADGDSGCILIVGNDADVVAAFKAWNKEAPRQVPIRQLQMLLFVLDKPEDAVIRELVRFLIDSMPSRIDLDIPFGERRLVVGRTPQLAAMLEGLEGMPWDINISDASIVIVESLIGLSNIHVDPTHATISATTFLLSEVEYLAWQEDSDGRAIPEANRIGGFLVRDELSFAWSNDEIARGLTDDDDSFVAKLTGAHSEPGDAASALLEALSCVPGIKLEDALDVGVLPEEWSGTVNGRLVELETAGRGDGGWEVTIWVTDGGQISTSQITCEFDASAYHIEVPDLFPAWQVSVYATPVPAAVGEWGAAEWLIRCVWGQDRQPGTEEGKP